MVTHCVANRLRLAARHRKFSLTRVSESRCALPFFLTRCKENANREQNLPSLLDCFAEMPLILCKGSNLNKHHRQLRIIGDRFIDSKE